MACVIAVSCKPQQAPQEVEEVPQDYSFGYNIKSAQTYDEKSHTETRVGNYTEGEFQVLQPDGMMRYTKYRTNPDGGMDMEVRYEKMIDLLPIFVKRVVEEDVLVRK